MTKKNDKDGSALDLLRGDYQLIQDLFSRYRKFKPGAPASAAKLDVIQEICAALSVHMRVQQELLYPAMREAGGSQPLPDEAEVRNAAILRLAGELQHVKPGDELADAKMKVLAEYVQSDIKLMESGLFARARQGGFDLRALGDQISARKAELASADAPAPDLTSGMRRGPAEEPVAART